jgi:hypothetical protein
MHENLDKKSDHKIGASVKYDMNSDCGGTNRQNEDFIGASVVRGG